jgi:iron complex outermembrane receptor protein
LSDGGDPLPRMPPFRVRAGVRYQRNALQVGGEVTGTAAQERVSGAEVPTDGFGLLKLFTSYSFVRGPVVHTITGRVDNVTDTLYRNHLSLIKELVPEMGRNFKVLYNLKF